MVETLLVDNPGLQENLQASLDSIRNSHVVIVVYDYTGKKIKF